VSDTPRLAEYRALRALISHRGTTRIVLLWAGIVAWAALLAVVLVWLPFPVMSALPLLVLVATFEGARTLHFGVERIGRYLQVFHEGGGDGDAGWEHVAMALGPRVPGPGGHPLGVPVLLAATVVNGLAVVLPGPLPAEWAAMLVLHLGFVAWMVACDRRMRAQRVSELREFERLRREAPASPSPQPPAPSP
jgi:hypothetical protein